MAGEPSSEQEKSSAPGLRCAALCHIADFRNDATPKFVRGTGNDRWIGREPMRFSREIAGACMVVILTLPARASQPTQDELAMARRWIAGNWKQAGRAAALTAGPAKSPEPGLTV